MRERLLQGFTLGHLRIEPRTRIVTGGAAPVHLPPRALEVLLRLAHEPGDIVERDELLRHAWGDGQGSAEALSHAVSELRHALGDDPSAPRFVQTVPRRGYRLIVEPQVEALPDSPTVDAGQDEPPPLLQIPFVGELMRRGVVQAGAAHLVVGWMLIQIAGETFVDLGLPPWAVPAVTYVVVAGFPLVITIAWFLELAEGRITVDRGDGHRLGGGLERNYLAIVAAYCIAAAGVGVYQVTVGIPVPESVPALAADEERALPVEPNSIAVLRFRTLGHDERARLFSAGLAEDVLDHLSRVPGLAVSSRTDAWSLPDDADSTEVRRRLRVAHYLEGSVRLIGNDLRVSVQMIETDNGFHEFSRTFERKLANFAEMQREITELTVANLRVALEPDTESWLASSYAATDVDAYVLYRKGREIFDAPMTVDSLQRAIGLFRDSLAFDPGYAAAHAGICSALVETFGLTGTPEDIDEAEKSCAAALVSNPNLYVVYAALGELYQQTNRVFMAEKAFRNALERNPNDSRSMIGLARVYQQQNHLELAEEQLERAMKSSPGNWRVIDTLGVLYFSKGEFRKAAEAFRKVLFLDTRNWQAMGNLGSALLMSGQFDEAADALRAALDIRPDEGSYSNLAIVYYYLGEFEQAVDIYRRALEQAPRSNVTWMNLADAQYFAGNLAGASASFARAIELSEERLAVNASDAESLVVLAWSHAMLDRESEARTLMDRTIRLIPNDPYAWYFDALVRLHSGDEDGACDSVAAALDRGYPLVMLRAEPHLAPLHEKKAFQAMLARNEE